MSIIKKKFELRNKAMRKKPSPKVANLTKYLAFDPSFDLFQLRVLINYSTEQSEKNTASRPGSVLMLSVGPQLPLLFEPRMQSSLMSHWNRSVSPPFCLLDSPREIFKHVNAPRNFQNS